MKKPIRLAHLSFKKIGTETVVLDTKGKKQVHQLNEVASFVWDLCEGKLSINEIITKVCEDFEVSLNDAHVDVEKLILKFEENKLIDYEGMK